MRAKECSLIYRPCGASSVLVEVNFCGRVQWWWAISVMGSVIKSCVSQTPWIWVVSGIRRVPPADFHVRTVDQGNRG